MDTPVIIVNFKTYEQGIGCRAVELARICDKVASDTGKSIAVSVSPVDVGKVSEAVSIPVLSEHMDPEEFGSHTGKVLAADLKENGASGTLLNHSEDRYRMDVLEQAVVHARKTGLISVVCANNSEMAEAIAAWQPDFIAVEPPELIGGKVSVSSARPEVISEAVEKVKRIDDNVKVLCGAGVHTREDVRKALKLGSTGVLLASGVVKSDDPEGELKDLASAL